MLPSKEELRESIIRRLTAVSDDICSAFQRTVDGYKTELDRQRRLIDVVWNPNIRLHVSDLQLLCNDVLAPTRRREPQPGPSQDGEPQPGPSYENMEDSSVEDPAEPERHTEPGTGKSFVECQECGKTFKLTFQLKRHLRIHSDKPYRCQT